MEYLGVLGGVSCWRTVFSAWQKLWNRSGFISTWSRAALFDQRPSSCRRWRSSRRSWATCRPSWAMRSRVTFSPSTNGAQWSLPPLCWVNSELFLFLSSSSGDSCSTVAFFTSCNQKFVSVILGTKTLCLRRSFCSRGLKMFCWWQVKLSNG